MAANVAGLASDSSTGVDVSMVLCLIHLACVVGVTTWCACVCGLWAQVKLAALELPATKVAAFDN
eukprot:11403339-Alexandrium_andersonii.AAC.1